MGVATACSSVAGICGALIYTQLRRCFGLERTGLLSFAFQVLCLVACVASIWMPGSPFDPDALFSRNIDSNDSVAVFELEANVTNDVTSSTDDGENSVYTSIVLFVSAIVVSRMGEDINRKRDWQLNVPLLYRTCFQDCGSPIWSSANCSKRTLQKQNEVL